MTPLTEGKLVTNSRLPISLALPVALLVLLFGAGAPCNALSAIVGADLFDLASQYQGFGSSLDGSQGALVVSQEMARKRIADAAGLGLRIARVAITGFQPDNPSFITFPGRDELGPWITDPGVYWQHMDEMFDDLDAAGIQIVPVLIWNYRQIPSLTGETAVSFFRYPTKSQAMFFSYLSQFVTRYAGRTTIAFYEFCNECNLDADLDMVSRCNEANPQNPEFCVSYGNFTSYDVASFGRKVAFNIRQLDPSRSVSSGFSFPRPDAFFRLSHLEWDETADWSGYRPDTSQEGYEYLDLVSSGFDIISAHIYPDTSDQWYGVTSTDTTWQFDWITQYAHSRGKRAFVGEFADPVTSPGSASSPLPVTPWLTEALSKLQTSGVDFAAYWIFEWYQATPYNPTFSSSIEPGWTDQIDSALFDLAGVSLEPPGPPRLAITWPLPCQDVENWESFVYVTASGPLPVTSVAALINGVLVGETSTRPFQIDIPQSYPSGIYTLDVIVTNAVGSTSVSYNIVLNDDASKYTSVCAYPSSSGTPYFPLATRASDAATLARGPTGSASMPRGAAAIAAGSESSLESAGRTFVGSGEGATTTINPAPIASSTDRRRGEASGVFGGNSAQQLRSKAALSEALSGLVAGLANEPPSLPRTVIDILVGGECELPATLLTLGRCCWPGQLLEVCI